MKKVVFEVGEFLDFTGKKRQVIFSAVSLDCEDADVTVWDDNGEMTNEAVPKVVRIGVSVQSPKDPIPNEILGKIIAEGKALKEKTCFGKIYSTDKGFINGTMVNALLKQEMDYFKQNPGKYIAGYNKDKDLFKQDPESYFNKMK